MDNELLKWIRENNFDVPDNATTDGKNYRFDRDGKKNASFWGVRSFVLKTGEPYYLASVHDFKTDETFEYKTNGAYSREDKKQITQQFKEGKEKAERVRLALQMDAGETAAAILAGSRVENPTDYMNRKQIPHLMGARICKQSVIDAQTGRNSRGFGNDDILVVPMRDASGKLWGLQKINNKGDKYFLAGQRIDSCLHLIPDDADISGNDPIYICEGFATGASIHLATQSTVAVAFNAGNLPAVARAIRAENSERPIVICADDDVWGRRPDGSPYNAGREKGLEAGKLVMGKTVFPRFRDETGRPTDWNDLHCREGLEEVRAQLLEIKPESHYVNCLGHRDGTYFYTSSDNKELVTIRAHAGAEMLNLMPMAYWESLYPGKKGGIDWLRATDELMRRCRAKGIFHPDNIRGLGVWDDAGRTVVHLGDRLNVDGQELGIHAMHSRYLYSLEPSCRSIHKKPLTLAECAPLHDLLQLIQFERSVQKYFLGGWIMAARLSGLLKWRPQIWITGESGSGKSTLLQEFVYPMLGDQKKRFTGGTTEAGMRQNIRADALPVTFDEFEPDSPESTQRVKHCLEFIRQASTDSGHVVKGSASGDAVRYKARFCAAVSAIKTLLNTQADRTRFTLIELRRVHNNTSQWAGVQRALKAFTPEYADRYFARLLTMLPAIQENTRRFEDAFSELHSQRLGQQYGPLMAGWAAITADGELNPSEIEQLVSSIDLSQEGAAEADSDQGDCLSYLLRKQITVSVSQASKDNVTVATAIDGIRAGNDLYNRELGIYGMRLLMKSSQGEGLFISNRNPQLTQVFEKSPWAAGWALSLGRLPGAKRNCQGWLDGRTTKGVLLPLKLIFPDR